jgi:pimeloyl-ACP methyl ester carboxylesterase
MRCARMRVTIDRTREDKSSVPGPTSPLNNQIAWLLETLRDGADHLTPDNLSERFSATFLELMPADAIIGLIQKMGSTLHGFSHAGFTRQPTEIQANIFLTAQDRLGWVAPISVQQEAPHRITGLAFAPVPVPDGITLSPPVDPSGTPVPGADRTDGLYDIGHGRKLYLSSVGQGGPTVVLESGFGDNAGAWFAVESAISRFTRVCSYDRPGAIGGASTPAEPPRTGLDTVQDLRALLHSAGIPGPYVLVGHSMGGVFARLFAHTWPDGVAGIVLVDSSHDDQISRISQLVPADLWAQMEALLIPPPASTPEGIDIPATLDRVREARSSGTLPELVLTVVSGGAGRNPDMFPTGWPLEEEHALWMEMQADLATLVPGARHVIAEQSGHYVHQSEPGLVIDAIRQVVMDLR